MIKNILLPLFRQTTKSSFKPYFNFSSKFLSQKNVYFHGHHKDGCCKKNHQI